MAKSAKGAGSIRQRSNGLWEARFSAGRDPATGKIIRKSVYGRTQKEVRKKLTEATAAVDSGTYTAPEKITFGQWLSIWLEEYCGAVKPRTRELYQNTVEYRIRPFLGGVRLVSLSPVMLQGFYNKSTAGQLEGVTAISGKTLHNVHGIIHKALQQAVSIGYIKANPADACILPKYQRRELRPLDEQETRAFIAALEGEPLRRLFLVALFTGMREGEIMGLCWDSVDFATGTISIRQQLQRHERKYIITPPKNGKSRLILPAPFVMQLLREEIGERVVETQRAVGDRHAHSGRHVAFRVGVDVARLVRREMVVEEKSLLVRRRDSLNSQSARRSGTHKSIQPVFQSHENTLLFIPPSRATAGRRSRRR